MKTLNTFEILNKSKNGIELLIDQRHLLNIHFLEDHICHIFFKINKKARMERTWMIQADEKFLSEGRKKCEHSAFHNPQISIYTKNNILSLQSKQLRLDIHNNPLHFIWHELREEEWIEIASDRPTGAYLIGKSCRDIAHYMTHKPENHYYGLGEKAGPINRIGKSYQMRSLDALGYNAETTDPLYKHWPFFQVYHPKQKTHYGILYDNLATATFNMGREIDNYHSPYHHYQAEDGDLDYYFFSAKSINDTTKIFLKLTGRPHFPPKWSLGYSGSTMHYTESPEAQKELGKFIQLCQKHAIPCDSFQLSSGYTTIQGKRYVFHWNLEKIPAPEKLAQDFHQAGMRLVANIKPCLLKDHPEYQNIKPLFIQDSEENTPEQSIFWDDSGSHLDFTNPETANWWQEKITTSLLQKGIDATWNDNNEYEIWDKEAKCHGFGDPIPIALIRPLMPLLMTHYSYQAQNNFSKERPYLISRSGSPGIQRYAQTWTGDNRSNWHTLYWNIPMAQGMSLSGIYHLGHDIGGFAGNAPSPELFLRWIQSALLLPRFTIHSWHDDQSVNEPWMYPEITNAVRDAICLRYRLIPYLYTLLYQAHQELEPIIRPLFLDHEHDPESFNHQTQYLIGNILTSPICAPEQTKHTIYLPENHGKGWYDYHKESYHSGGQQIQQNVQLESIPLFIKAGSIIPESKLYHADSPEKDYFRKLKIFPLKGIGQCKGIIYDDDGTSKNGEHLIIHWQMDCQKDHIHLKLELQGNYKAPYLKQIHLHMPPTEKRQLHIQKPEIISTITS